HRIARAAAPPPKANPLACRGQAARDALLKAEGGSAASEKAVAAGLRWLALHQAQDGRWSLNEFNKHARQKPWPEGKVFTDDSTQETTRTSDVAGTAFALLAFLAGGHTSEKPTKESQNEYHQGIATGLKWLASRQRKTGAGTGFFGDDVYSHGLATLAM